jgi:hypothetical protein
MCLLWNRPPPSTHPAKHERSRLVSGGPIVWLGGTICTIAVYVPGYTLGKNGCTPASSCSASVALHHPATTVRFFFVLIGNVIPAGTSYGEALLWYGGLARFEFVGVVLFIASIYIVVRSWRQRRTTERCPLPLLLICFALAFDVTIALGRSGNGEASPLLNRYVMPNIILLLGVATYTLARLPRLLIRRNGLHWRDIIRLVAGLAFAALLVTQVIDATGFGLMNAPKNRAFFENSSRLFVNFGQIPASEKVCEAVTELYFQPGAYSGGWTQFRLTLNDATIDHLGEFQTQPARAMRAIGPPPLSANCAKAVGT